MGKPSRDKGARFERECVHEFKDRGVPAERVPLSGAMHGSFGGDVRIKTRDGWALAECKTRKRAWMDLFNWLPGNDLLLIKADRTDTLVVMSLDKYVELIR